MLNLQDIKKRFPTILDYGSGSGHISKFLDDELARKIIQVDDSGLYAKPPIFPDLILFIFSKRKCSIETLMNN